jgi:hypothetical protein
MMQRRLEDENGCDVAFFIAEAAAAAAAADADAVAAAAAKTTTAIC